MNRIKCFLGVALSILLGGNCYSESTSEKRILLNFDEAIERGKELKMSDFFSSVDYVPLETTENSLLSPQVNYYISDNYILAVVFDVKSPYPAYLFDRQGKFLRTIGVFGKGPHELLKGIVSGYIDESRGRVALFYGVNTCGVSWYDLSGEWLGDKQMSHEDLVSYVRGKGNTRYYSSYMPTFSLMGTDERLILVDQNFDSTRIFMGPVADLGNLNQVSDVFGTYIRETGEVINIGSEQTGHGHSIKATAYTPSFIQYSDYIGMYDYEGRRYCRFYYDGRIEYPYGVYCTQQRKLPGLQRANYKYCIKSWVETDRFCFIELLADGTYLLVYDKHKDHLYSSLKDGRGIKNDMVGCSDVYWWPTKVTGDGLLYARCFVSFIKEREGMSSDPKIKALVDSLKEDDNEVLVFAHPKK